MCSPVRLIFASEIEQLLPSARCEERSGGEDEADREVQRGTDRSLNKSETQREVDHAESNQPVPF